MRSGHWLVDCRLLSGISAQRPTEPARGGEPSPTLLLDSGPVASTQTGVISSTAGEEATADECCVLTDGSRICDGDTGVCPDPDRSMVDGVHVAANTTADGDTRYTSSGGRLLFTKDTKLAKKKGSAGSYQDGRMGESVGIKMGRCKRRELHRQSGSRRRVISEWQFQRS